MTRRLAALPLVAMIALTGCTETAPRPDPTTRAESLWSARTPYVGDSSKVASLVREVQPEDAGAYTIVLQTASEPYGLTIEMTEVDDLAEQAALTERATLLLGLVENLDEVSITAADDTYTLTSADASTDLGFDVRELGRERGKLTTYLGAESD